MQLVLGRKKGETLVSDLPYLIDLADFLFLFFVG